MLSRSAAGCCTRISSRAGNKVKQDATSTYVLPDHPCFETNKDRFFTAQRLADPMLVSGLCLSLSPSLQALHLHLRFAFWLFLFCSLQTSAIGFTQLALDWAVLYQSSSDIAIAFKSQQTTSLHLLLGSCFSQIWGTSQTTSAS